MYQPYQNYNSNQTTTSESAEASENTTAKKHSKSKSESKNSKANLIFLITGIIASLGGIACILFVFLAPKDLIPDLVFPEIPSQKTSEVKIYSTLTGKELASESEKTAPIYCVQTPNAAYDGTRPQTGLTEAGVVFEAIAERGITRFAALYQNPKSGIIGPIRSLRLYFLEWDTPFDCTVVHAGGADDAMAAVRSGRYSHIEENYTYMYRGNYAYHNWNNLFTTPQLLANFSSDTGKVTSNPTSLTRMTPEEADHNLIDNQIFEKLDITTSTEKNTSELSPKISNINLGFGYNQAFNLNYRYNPSTNTYDRYFATGNAHTVYNCVNENLYDKDPTDVCSETTLSPSVVIAIFINEHVASDNYHETITTTGSNLAYVFQNGIAIKGTWQKSSVEEQIRFYDESGQEIALAPGQTWISAIPEAYGGYVEY